MKGKLVVTVIDDGKRNGVGITYEIPSHDGINKKGTGPGVNMKKTKTINIIWNQWEYALQHLGEEVEFDIVENEAKIIPKPISYTEAQVEMLLYKFWFIYADRVVCGENTLKQFWETNKNK